MKYLKTRIDFIKEAFDSKSISKTLSYISKNCPTGKEEFLESIKSLMYYYDYPISKLSDAHIEYLSSKKAKEIKLPKGEEVFNEWKIYCIKFWFSIEKGYLGYTGTPEKEHSYIQSKKINLDHKDILKLSDEKKTGLLTPAEDVTKLNHGDTVAGIFNEYDDGILTWAKIFKDGRGNIFAIQNVSDGGRPEGNNWRKWGRYSWQLYSGYQSEDHHKLHLYVEDDKPLRTSITEYTENPLDWNLPIKSGKLKTWDTVQSLHRTDSIYDEKQIDDSDFCLVLYLDDMMNPDKAEFYKKASEIKKSRQEEKEGATALMSDEEIKNANIDRYVKAMIQKYGIRVENPEFINLQNLLLTTLMGKYSLINIINGRHEKIIQINQYLWNMILSEDVSDKKYYFDYVLDYFKRVKKNVSNLQSEFSESMKLLTDEELSDYFDESEKLEFLEIFDRIMKLGEKICEKIKSNQINTIEDLAISISKLESLKRILSNEQFKLGDRFHSLLKWFSSQNDVEHYLSRMENVDLKQSKRAIVNIERAIDSILK